MKKVLAVFLSAILIFTISLGASISVYALDNDPKIVVSSQDAGLGETVAVTVAFKNSPGVAAVKLYVAFPSDLTLVSIGDAANTNGNNIEDLNPEPGENAKQWVNYDVENISGYGQQPSGSTSPVALIWANLADVSGDFIFATLNFKVDDNATLGDKDITVTYNLGDICNIAENNVGFELTNGKITVHNYIIEPAVLPTCTANGWTEGRYCQECDKIILEKTRVPATGHSYVNNKCTVCGYVKPNLPDVNYNDWYGEAIEYVTSANIMLGYSNGNFGTSDGIQRQDFILILARLSGADLSQYESTPNFTDSGKEAYYYTALGWAKATGVANGYGNGKFGVGDKITREQIMAFLYNYATVMGYDTTVKADNYSSIADYGSVSSFAKTAAAWAISNGVLSGKNTPEGKRIAPQASAQRCEVAAILLNIRNTGLFEKA